MTDGRSLLDELTFFEGADVEYKAARGGLPGDLWETYSAFANTDGGTIWLGVSQRDGELDVHGAANPEKLASDFWNTLNNRGKVSANLLRNGDVEIVPVAEENRSVVRIRVPRAERRQRPVFLGSDPFRGSFRRNFEGDYRCTEAEVRRMFADQADEPADSRVLGGFSLDDLHGDSIRQFRNLAAVGRIARVWLAEDDQGLLRKLGGWRRDRTTGAEGLTLAGLLLFGRNEAIRDPAAAPNFHLDYRERFSEDPAIRWTDRLTPDGTWEGNLFQFYQQVMLKLSSGPGIRRPFQIDAHGHRIASTPVGEALQEALVNALIHADYGGQGGIVIDRFADRMVFSNPGTLLVSREQLLQGGVSECRNKSLQLMFQVLGAGDKAGSGIDKIRTSWAGEHWRSPILRETWRPDRVVLELSMVSVLPDELLGQLERRLGNVFSLLNASEVQAVATAALEGEVSNQRLQELLSLHRTDITLLLRRLVEMKILDPHGLGRGTRYVLGLGGADGLFSPHVGQAGHDDSLHVGTSSPQDEAESAASPSKPSPLEALSDPERALVLRVASGQVPRELTREAIRLLCGHDFLSSRQLGEILQRNPDGLRDRFLAEMVASGLLEQRYPGARHHRNQGYRAVGVVPQGPEDS